MIRPAFLTLAVLLTVALFAVGARPGAGDGFVGYTHWVAHAVTYAAIAAAYALALPGRSVILLAVFVTAIGAVHEVVEIRTHSHALELLDIAVNGLGAFIGALLARPVFARVGA